MLNRTHAQLVLRRRYPDHHQLPPLPQTLQPGFDEHRRPRCINHRRDTQRKKLEDRFVQVESQRRGVDRVRGA